MNIIIINNEWLFNKTSPYYLDQNDTEYILDLNITTDGTAFVILAKNVILNLNGYTVTYNNENPIIVNNGGFESGDNGWILSNDSEILYNGSYIHNQVASGNNSLKFNIPCSNQEIISQSTITLEPDTWYALSAMFKYGSTREHSNNQSVKMYVRLVGENLPTIETFWNSTNWRGIQLVEKEFKTGAIQETYNIHIGIEGAAGASTTAAYIDDVSITKTKNYGVACSAFDWALNYYKDITRYGRCNNPTIKNGIIRQGSNRSCWSHAVIANQAGLVNIENCVLEVYGNNTSCIFGFTTNSIIKNNTLISNVNTVTSRDNMHGLMIRDIYGTIDSNTFLNGPHGGIYPANNKNIISNNTFRIKSNRYTNSFCIFLRGEGSEAYGNNIDCVDDDYACRGIVTGGNLPNKKIYNNMIRLKPQTMNQEYEGESLGGAYGIQIENGVNVEVFNNIVEVFGRGGKVYAFRINENSSSLSVHNNVFIARAESHHAGIIKTSDCTAPTILFKNNTLITNDGIVQESTNSNIKITDCNIRIVQPVFIYPYPIESEYSASTAIHLVIDFVNCEFTDEYSRNYLYSAVCRGGHRYNPNNELRIERRAVFNIKWTPRFLFFRINGEVLEDGKILNVYYYNDQSNPALSMSIVEGEAIAEILEQSTTGDIVYVTKPHKPAIEDMWKAFNLDISHNDRIIVILPE